MTANVRLHVSKTDPKEFGKSILGTKRYELRYNDRDFRVGDRIRLRETHFTGKQIAKGSPAEYTGRAMLLKIVSILPLSKYIKGKEVEDWIVMCVDPCNEEV